MKNKTILEEFKLCICGKKKVFELDAFAYCDPSFAIDANIIKIRYCGNNECYNKLISENLKNEEAFYINMHEF